MSTEPIVALIQLLVPLLVICLPCGLLSRNLARKKGYTGYFWTGFLLLVLGLIYVAGLPVASSKYAVYNPEIAKSLEEYNKKG